MRVIVELPGLSGPMASVQSVAAATDSGAQNGGAARATMAGQAAGMIAHGMDRLDGGAAPIGSTAMSLNQDGGALNGGAATSGA